MVQQAPSLGRAPQDGQRLSKTSPQWAQYLPF